MNILNIMDIDKILRDQRRSRALIGLSKLKFEELLKEFSIELNKHLNNKKRIRIVGGGRKGNIKEPRQKLFFILFYLKNYPTFDVAAHIFASSKTQTNNWVKNILPVLEATLKRKCVLPVRQLSSVEEFYTLFPNIKEVMIDGLERPIERSQKNKNQRNNFSGKKKRHTRKNVIVVDSKKRILINVKSKKGKTHDKKILDKSQILNHIPQKVSIIADTGFQGIQHIHENALIPKKNLKSKPLTKLDKEMNKLISSTRIVVEHAIAGIKRFRITSNIFRNKNGMDDKIFNICAGLWNYHLA
jgi:hypothetical protein